MAMTQPGMTGENPDSSVGICNGNELAAGANLRPLPINDLLWYDTIEPQEGEFHQLKPADQESNMPRPTANIGARYGIRHNRSNTLYQAILI